MLTAQSVKMLEYLVILLDDTSTSYCHYTSKESSGLSKLISKKNLKDAILFAMKENLSIQYIYPAYVLPADYTNIINSLDHTKTMPLHSKNSEDADVVILKGVEDLHSLATPYQDKLLTLQMKMSELYSLVNLLQERKKKFKRLNIVFTDILEATESILSTYKEELDNLVEYVFEEYQSGNPVQINILTDRMNQKTMNNCDAGISQITLAPNGKFYICPAFYYENEDSSVGDLERGINIKNKQLYSLSHAPICRVCDAFQCHRCIWMNKKSTFEVNTPSHEQCVAAHLERNASKRLIEKLQTLNTYHFDTEIEEIDYLDPLEKAINNIR